MVSRGLHQSLHPLCGVLLELDTVMQSKMLPHFAQCRQHCGQVQQSQDAMIICANGSWDVGHACTTVPTQHEQCGCNEHVQQQRILPALLCAGQLGYPADRDDPKSEMAWRDSEWQTALFKQHPWTLSSMQAGLQ